MSTIRSTTAAHSTAQITAQATASAPAEPPRSLAFTQASKSPAGDPLAVVYAIQSAREQVRERLASGVGNEVWLANTQPGLSKGAVNDSIHSIYLELSRCERIAQQAEHFTDGVHRAQSLLHEAGTLTVGTSPASTPEPGRTISASEAVLLEGYRERFASIAAQTPAFSVQSDRGWATETVRLPSATSLVDGRLCDGSQDACRSASWSADGAFDGRGQANAGDVFERSCHEPHAIAEALRELDSISSRVTSAANDSIERGFRRAAVGAENLLSMVPDATLEHTVWRELRALRARLMQRAGLASDALGDLLEPPRPVWHA